MSERELKIVLKVAADSGNNTEAVKAVESLNKAQKESSEIAKQAAKEISESSRTQAHAMAQATAEQQKQLSAVTSVREEMAKYAQAYREASDPVGRLTELLKQEKEQTDRMAQASRTLSAEMLKMSEMFDRAAKAADNPIELAKITDELNAQSEIVVKATDNLKEAKNKIEGIQNQMKQIPNAVDHLKQMEQSAASYEAAMDRMEQSNKKILNSAQQMMTGVTQLARSFILATVAKEEDAKAALQLIAQFESVVQGLQGVINVGKSATEMWKAYKTAADSAAVARMAATGGGVGKLATAGGSLMGTGGMGAGGLTGLAGIGTTAAAFIAAIGSMALAATVVTEQLTGAADGVDKNGNATSVSGKIAAGELWAAKAGLGLTDGWGGRTAFRMSGMGQIMGAEEVIQNFDSDKSLEQAQKRRNQMLAKQQQADDIWDRVSPQEEHQRSSAKRMAELEWESNAKAKGLKGTDLDKSVNQSAIGFANKSLIDNQRELEEIEKRRHAGEIMGKEQELDLLRRQASTYQELEKLERDKARLAEESAKNQVAAEREKLTLAKDNLKLAEDAKEAAKSEYERGRDQLARATPEELLAIKNATERARRGEILSPEEVDLLRNFKQFDQAGEMSLEELARQHDTNGLLNASRERYQTAIENQKKFDADVKVQNQILVTLEGQAEEDIKKAETDLTSKLRELMTNQNRVTAELIDRKLNEMTRNQGVREGSN